jgi:hypothetical protein
MINDIDAFHRCEAGRPERPAATLEFRSDGAVAQRERAGFNMTRAPSGMGQGVKC